MNEAGEFELGLNEENIVNDNGINRLKEKINFNKDKLKLEKFTSPF